MSRAGSFIQEGMAAMHLVAIHIKAKGPFHMLENDGLSANRLERTHWGVDTSRQQCLRLLENLQTHALGQENQSAE